MLYTYRYAFAHAFEFYQDAFIYSSSAACLLEYFLFFSIAFACCRQIRFFAISAPMAPACPHIFASRRCMIHCPPNFSRRLTHPVISAACSAYARHAISPRLSRPLMTLARHGAPRYMPSSVDMPDLPPAPRAALLCRRATSAFFLPRCPPHCWRMREAMFVA